MYTYMVGICIAAGQLRCSTTIVWWTGSVGREPLQSPSRAHTPAMQVSQQRGAWTEAFDKEPHLQLSWYSDQLSIVQSHSTCPAAIASAAKHQQGVEQPYQYTHSKRGVLQRSVEIQYTQNTKLHTESPRHSQNQM